MSPPDDSRSWEATFDALVAIKSVSLPRPIICKRTAMSTRRCSERRFFLRPSERTNQAILYALGYASETFGVELHHCLVMGNHHHTGHTDHFGMLSDFLQAFHQLVARSLNVELGRSEALWSATEQTSVVDQMTPEDAFRSMIYALTNGVQAQLVERAHQWPGVSSLSAQLLDRTMVVRRPHWFYDPDGDMPTYVRLRFTRLPGFEHLSHAEWVAKVKAAIAVEEAKAARERARTGRRVLGRKAVKAQSPFGAPRTGRGRGGVSPRVKAKNRWRRVEALRRNKQWLAEYRDAYGAYREGRAATFPHGTNQLRRFHGVRCAAGPGPIGLPYAATLV